MLSAEARKYTARAIIQLLAGNKQKVEEYCNYVNKTIEIHREEPKLVRCRYKKNGQWIQAEINWSTGIIKDLQGNVLWEGKKICG